MLIFVVAISVINGAYRFYEANSTFSKNIESNYGLKMKEMMLKRLGSEELIAEYNKQKEEAIAEAKKKLYIYLAVLEVGLLAVHLGALPLEKKFIHEACSRGRRSPGGDVALTHLRHACGKIKLA